MDLDCPARRFRHNNKRLGRELRLIMNATVRDLCADQHHHATRRDGGAPRRATQVEVNDQESTMKYAIAIVMLVTIALPTASAQRECGNYGCGFGQGGRLTVIRDAMKPPPGGYGPFPSSDCTPYYGAAKQACLKQKVRR
jgi:hypothetical protein